MKSTTSLQDGFLRALFKDAFIAVNHSNDSMVWPMHGLRVMTTN